MNKRRERIRSDTLEMIDGMIEEFGENIPYLHDFRAELVPLIRKTARHLDKLLDLVPGPVTLDPDRWDRDPLIHSICVSEKRTAELIADSTPLQRFFRSSQAEIAFALLTAEKREKTVTGTEKNGEIIRRDVLQKAVFFEEHQIRWPSETLEKTRRQVQQLLLSELFALAAEKISDLKEWRSELELQHDEITAKMSFYKDSPEHEKIDDLHDTIEGKIKEIGSTLDSPEDYKSHLQEFIQNPQQYLTAKSVYLRLSPMGILLRNSSTEKANAFPLAEFKSASGKKWVATWISVP
ncbi:MAG: hypothetical protein V2I56_22350, partial [Desulfobacteraceae bacterium]|nr:hypothetical protein [Desulfobacteraceae bacterium]